MQVSICAMKVESVVAISFLHLILGKTPFEFRLSQY